MENLLAKVKANLIIEHSADDALLTRCIAAATAYAEATPIRAVSQSCRVALRCIGTVR